MPFLQLTTNHTAGSHFSRAIGLSSKIVPTLAENCFLQERHFQIRRVDRKDGSGALQRGQVMLPSGQCSLATKVRLTSGSLKNSIASSSVSGAPFRVSMKGLYRKGAGVSSTSLRWRDGGLNAVTA